MADEPKMTGRALMIGGVFLLSRDPRALADWYRQHLGWQFGFLEDDDTYYVEVYYREEHHPEVRPHLVYAALAAGLLAAAMMPGVAWAAKPIPQLILTPDTPTCTMSSQDEIGFTIDVSGVHGKVAYVDWQFTVTVVGTLSGTAPIDLTSGAGSTGIYYDYDYNSYPNTQITSAQARLTRKNGHPIGDWQTLTDPIACTYS